MSRSTKIATTVIIVGGIIAAVAFKLVANKKETEAKVYHPDINTAVTVQVDTVKLGRFDLTTEFTGSFAANREVTLASETTGRVIKVNIEEGSHVNAGQLIAQLDDGLIQAQLKSAQANYEKALNVLQRYQLATSGITQLQMDNAKTDIQTSKAQVEQLKKQINQFAIAAPFSGIITSRNFDLGAIVSPGMQMATLIDISQLKLEISVPEKSIARFKINQPIDITTDVYQGTNFKGTVDMIASKADAAHNFKVKVRVPNSNTALRSGMYGTVVLNNVESIETLTIPRSALLGSAVKPQVYVIENAVARLRDIQTGNGNESRIQVTGGLQKGELVIAGGLVNVNNGSKVSIAN